MTMTEPVERSGVQVYADPRDGRIKLQQASDAEQIDRPTPPTKDPDRWQPE